MFIQLNDPYSLLVPLPAHHRWAVWAFIHMLLRDCEELVCENNPLKFTKHH